ncbi:MAG: response regulator transcription factor [Granulosicoccus sp.]
MPQAENYTNESLEILNFSPIEVRVMSQFTLSGTTRGPVPRNFPFKRTSLEDRLEGLSDNELLQLQDLLTWRLMQRSPTHEKSTNSAHSAMELLNLKRLTARENEVLTLIASGYTRPEVAKALSISRNTAATHVANIYRKLEIESIAEATMLAFRWGMVS